MQLVTGDWAEADFLDERQLFLSSRLGLDLAVSSSLRCTLCFTSTHFRACLHLNTSYIMIKWWRLLGGASQQSGNCGACLAIWEDSSNGRAADGCRLGYLGDVHYPSSKLIASTNWWRQLSRATARSSFVILPHVARLTRFFSGCFLSFQRIPGTYGPEGQLSSLTAPLLFSFFVSFNVASSCMKCFGFASLTLLQVSCCVKRAQKSTSMHCSRSADSAYPTDTQPNQIDSNYYLQLQALSATVFSVLFG